MKKDFSIVISSRVRLARNISGFPFRIDEEEKAAIGKTVVDLLRQSDEYAVYRMSLLSVIEKAALIEDRLISKELAEDGGVALINKNKTISVMVGEEDHIREQCILSGLSLKEAYSNLRLIDGAISDKLRFAYHPKYGYLTSCLTNTGTGMRASVMMFLPALSLTDSISRCVSGITRMNMAIRGVYGEGSQTEGYMYQISNQKTLGITENEIIDSVAYTAERLVEAELSARESLMHANPVWLKDNILRSYGGLKNCYKLSFEEYQKLIAFVKLGIYYNMLDGDADIERLSLDIMPAKLALTEGRSLDAGERDVIRAQIVGHELKKIERVQ